MRHIITFDEYNEVDFKPSELIQKYVELVEEDLKAIIKNEGGSFIDMPCPGCLSDQTAASFEKFGLTYVECSKCGTLRVSPRPDDAALYRFYTESTSRTFWMNEIARSTRGKRKDKIVTPRFEWVADTVGEYNPRSEHYVDVNTSQQIMLHEIDSTIHASKKSLISPFLTFDGSKYPNLNIFEGSFFDVDPGDDVDIITLFEVVDRTSNVEKLFERLSRMLNKNGLCFLTAVLVSGLDLQVLWDHAENLFPPDRLNSFTVEGLEALVTRHGFTIREFSTPGILDVELIQSAREKHPDIVLPRFLKYLLDNRSQDDHRLFQEFLQASLLSSYGRISIQKT